jgi:hypothetical protein
LKGRVIRYKPVAKLRGKTGKKMKGGGESNNSESNNNNRKFAAGPAPENSNNNNDSRKNEQVAFITLRLPEDRFENTSDYDKKIIQLKELDNDIFNIIISDSSRGNGYGGREPFTTIFITFNNLSKAKNKKKFGEHLKSLIKILKYFKEAADTKLYETEFDLFTPDESFTPDHNQFLKMLPQMINPI